MPIRTQNCNTDGTLKDSIATLQQRLLDAGFYIVEQYYINPIANVWSLKVCDRNCPLLFANGKGTSKKAALECALRDFVARLSSHYFWSNWYLGDAISNIKFIHHAKEEWFKINVNGSLPDGVLDDELRDFYNPDGDLNANNLVDINSSNRERGICCIPFESVGNGKITNFPINIVNNLYANNGLSTGNTIEEARVHALSEIFEHYINFKVIAEALSLPNIPDKILSRYPSIQETIKEIEEAGYPLLIQDASLGGKYPVLVVTLINPQNQTVCASFGANPKFEIALENCFTKLLQGRALDYIDGYTEAGFDMDEIASPHNLESHFTDSNGIVAWKFLNDKADYEFVDWSKKHSNINSLDEFTQLCDTIHAEGNDIFISDHNDLGVYTCRILVPGMSEIYPADDLVWENNNVGMDVRSQILKTAKTTEECEKLIEDLEELNQEDECLVSDLIGLPADTANIFNDFCVAELITLLALKTQDNERIQEGCEWLIHFQQINPRRLKVYQCINTILQLEGMTNYATALEKLYTSRILNDALALIAGEDVFLLKSEWKMHGLLIEAYKKMIKIQN